MKYLFVLISIFVTYNTLLVGQVGGVSIADSQISPDVSAMLDVKSTTKGILIPTMSFQQMTDMQNIHTPRHGLLVFVDDSDNNKDGFYFWDVNAGGGSWTPLGGGSSLWEQVGTDIQNTNPEAVIIYGNDQENKLFFSGTIGDNQSWMETHTAIVERVYEPNTEKSELLIFKGNDVDNNNGPDKIRIDAVGGTFFQVGNGNREYDPTNEGFTVMSILPDETVALGKSPSDYSVEFRKQDPIYPSKRVGTVILKNLNDTPGSRRYLVLGSDGNELNALAENSTGATLYFNYANGGDIYVGGHPGHPTSKFSVNGDIYAHGTITSSDRTLKKNIKPINNTLSIVLKLNPVTYTWRSENLDQKLKYGLIAQDVERVIPTLVTETNFDKSKNPKVKNHKSLDYVQLVPILIKAVQELNQKLESSSGSGNPNNEMTAQLRKELAAAQSKIQTQEKTITDLSNRLARLEKILSRLENSKTKNDNPKRN